MTRRTRRSWAAAACGLVPAVLPGACSDGGDSASDRDPCAFDSAEWRAADPDKSRRVERMAEQLVDCRTLIGMTRDQVVGLLGEGVGGVDKFDALEYTVGWGMIDPLVLSIDFDPRGIVYIASVMET